MVHTFTLDYFDLQQIADSGQCFRMIPVEVPTGCGMANAEETSASCYRLISGPHFLEIRQRGRDVSFCCPEEELPFWFRYFDLDTDYGSFHASIRKRDTYLQEAARAGRGIRILRQDPWEMILTFVISQQKTIPMIREAVERLCRQYGQEKTITIPGETLCTFHTFPRPEELARASLEDLQALKLGYRAKYIHRLCQDACAGRLDLELLPSLSYDEAMDYLSGFYGIGRKVANCICLFGLHHTGAFPVDTWIQKILMTHYYPKNRRKYRDVPKARLCDALIRDYFGSYEGFAGVMQQYIFYYERLKAEKIR